VNYNGRATVLETIRSLYAQAEIKVKIHVFDDNSSDGSPELIKKKFPEIPVYHQARNTGRPNILRNEAIKIGGSGLIFISDNDILYDRYCLRELLRAMEGHDKVAACVPRLMYWHEPDRIYLAGSRVHFLGASVAPNRDEIIARPLSQEPSISTGGGILLLDCEKIAQSGGGFDSDYMHGWGEDGEFYQRLMLSGFKSLYVPEAFGLHENKLLKLRKHRAEGQIYNRWMYIVSHYSFLTLVLLLPAFGIYEVMQFIFMLLKGLVGIYLKGTWKALLHLPLFIEKRRCVQKLRKIQDSQLLIAGDMYVAPSLLKENAFLQLLLKGINVLFDCYWRLVRVFIK
jgi:hypothetical protein